MRIYLCRHAEAESGDRMDPTRELTSIGKQQARVVGKWLKRQTHRPEIVIESNMKRSRQTAKRIAAQLGVDRVQATRGFLDPDADADQAWEEIIRIGNEAAADCVIAVTHHPLINALVAKSIASVPDLVQFPHAAIAHIDSDTDTLHWLVTPNVIARDEDEQELVGSSENLSAEESALVDAIGDLADLMEAAGQYYYEDITYKRWILGPGGRAGNCEECIENADEGEIEESEPFPAASQYGPVDEPPAHDHCECEVRYRDTVRRVYV